MLKEKIVLSIKSAILEVAREASVECNVDVKVEYPANEKFGDYATACALELAKVFRKPPIQIAQSIASKIEGDFEKVEVAPPGFINITLSKKTLEEAVLEIVENEDYGKNCVEKENILIEYVSANPTGPLHIGHGRWAAIGDALSRLLSFAGHKVDTEFYINDAGSQIDKLNESVKAARENREIPEDGYHGAYIKELAKMEDEPKALILEEQKKLLEKFGAKFDRWFSEKTLRESGAVEETMSLLEEKGYSFEKEGALWFKSSAFGDDKDRVLRKTDGSYTYFAVDVAYHRDKVKRGYNRLITILGADHHGYIPRITAAVNVFSDGKTILTAILGQLVRLFRGDEQVRMSKRTGDMISLEEVMEEIGVDSTRYYLLMRSANTTLDFDLELAKRQDNENPVYYLQYAYARICNIFIQLKEKGFSYNGEKEFTLEVGGDEEASRLIKMLLRFPEEVKESALNFEMHRFVSYLYDLAASLHRYYYKNIVLDEDVKIRTSRLTLMLACKRVLEKGFDILGITKKETM